MEKQIDRIGIFKTKGDVLSAMGRKDVKISDNVLNNPDFTSASNKELLGFIAESGSDYTLIEVKAVKNNPQAFVNLAFGQEGKSDTTKIPV